MFQVRFREKLIQWAKTIPLSDRRIDYLFVVHRSHRFGFICLVREISWMCGWVSLPGSLFTYAGSEEAVIDQHRLWMLNHVMMFCDSRRSIVYNWVQICVTVKWNYLFEGRETATVIGFQSFTFADCNFSLNIILYALFHVPTLF